MVYSYTWQNANCLGPDQMPRPDLGQHYLPKSILRDAGHKKGLIYRWVENVLFSSDQNVQIYMLTGAI